MINIVNPQSCCGCTACASACNHNAIQMVPDNLGFLYPMIDMEKCVDCGLCNKICAFNTGYDKSINLKSPSVVAVRHNDVKHIETSRSGAAFVAFSDWILQNGGVVYGAATDKDFLVRHIRVETTKERDRLKGSKYIQSELTGIFQAVKNDLKAGRLVLFSGTACQTAGLNSYIGSHLRKKLYLIDIVCHGVASSYIWKDYLEYLEKKTGKKILSVNFRNKREFGYKAHRETFLFEGEYRSRSFHYSFYEPIHFRTSCNVCPFCNVTRPSDVTLADFWGEEPKVKQFNYDDRGCSCVFINTEKGREWFDVSKKDVSWFELPIENAMQPNLLHPSSKDPLRESFEQDYVNHGFEYVGYKYGNLGLSHLQKTIVIELKDIVRRIRVLLKKWL